MSGFAKVKEHTRRTKSGKRVVVKAHSRKTRAEQMAEEDFKKSHPHVGADGIRYRSKGEEYQRIAQKKKREKYDKNVEVLEKSSKSSKWSKMPYREAVKAGAPKLSPYYGERISKRMNYATALKHGYTTVKGIKKRVRRALNNE